MGPKKKTETLIIKPLFNLEPLTISRVDGRSVCFVLEESSVWGVQAMVAPDRLTEEESDWMAFPFWNRPFQDYGPYSRHIFTHQLLVPVSTVSENSPIDPHRPCFHNSLGISQSRLAISAISLDFQYIISKSYCEIVSHVVWNIILYPSYTITNCVLLPFVSSS